MSIKIFLIKLFVYRNMSIDSRTKISIEIETNVVLEVESMLGISNF